MYKIKELSEDTEKLNIEQISLEDIKNYPYHICHSGKLNKQVLNYLIYNTKVSFEEIEKLFTFDFNQAEEGKTYILVNGVAMRR